MMNAVMASISSLILLLVFGHSACQASPISLAANGGPSHHSHNQVDQQQHKKQMATSGEELVGQLLRLAEPTTGDEGAVKAREQTERQLESLLTRAAKKQHQLAATKPSKRRDQDDEEQAFAREKAALKRKWHKLVDDVFEPERQHQEQKVKFAVNQPQARKRNLQALQPAQAQDDSNQDERLAVILIKRKPQLDETHDASSAPLSSNNLGDLEATASGQQQQQQPQRGPINMADHQRRILDDKFGILGQSIFTTNNQLGNKGVPKYGSDEQF